MGKKYRLGSLVLEAVKPFVRVTLLGQLVVVIDQPTPSAAQVAGEIAKIRGYWPDSAVLTACGRVAADAAEDD